MCNFEIEIFNSLIGQWRMSRTISNECYLIGKAELIYDNQQRILFKESGQLHTPEGQILEAQQSYLFQASKNYVSVYFDSNATRLFHTLTMMKTNSLWKGIANHVCINDEYYTEYNFQNTLLFSIHHCVNGPRKSYTMFTTYNKIT